MDFQDRAPFRQVKSTSDFFCLMSFLSLALWFYVHHGGLNTQKLYFFPTLLIIFSFKAYECSSIFEIYWADLIPRVSILILQIILGGVLFEMNLSIVLIWAPLGPLWLLKGINSQGTIGDGVLLSLAPLLTCALMIQLSGPSPSHLSLQNPGPIYLLAMLALFRVTSHLIRPTENINGHIDQVGSLNMQKYEVDKFVLRDLSTHIDVLSSVLSQLSGKKQDFVASDLSFACHEVLMMKTIVENKYLGLKKNITYSELLNLDEEIKNTFKRQFLNNAIQLELKFILSIDHNTSWKDKQVDMVLFFSSLSSLGKIATQSCYHGVSIIILLEQDRVGITLKGKFNNLFGSDFDLSQRLRKHILGHSDKIGSEKFSQAIEHIEHNVDDKRGSFQIEFEDQYWLFRVSLFNLNYFEQDYERAS